ncbi:hypothetical protein FLGE108171_15065 [Flavobacterium gelidilacus]|uniref:hypothetical protein n=1 Tax=Flavobacterium gelidilacus TaxID=206041 RepID=UPI0004132D3D|nr:hypothetical protein [Flavobacterium gelidilacus]
MKNSDFIIEWVDKLKFEMDCLTFMEDDIRKDFYGLINDVAYCYYRPWLLYEISFLTNQEKLEFGSLNENIHIKAIKALTKNSVSSTSHFNSLNRNFILDAWSTFEICVNTFCEGVSNAYELERLLNHKYSDYIKLLPKGKLNDDELKVIKTKLITKHLTHVPIVRKTDALFKKTVSYSRNIDEDKRFLLFFGALRNTMHSNFIYYGKTFEYKFGHAIFKFEDGEMVKWFDPFEATPKLYFYMVGYLKDIWRALIDSIKWEEIIYYPNLEQQ